MSNPTKNEFIYHFTSTIDNALGGISGEAELSDEQLTIAAQSITDAVDTVAPNKGKLGIKYGVVSE